MLMSLVVRMKLGGHVHQVLLSQGKRRCSPEVLSTGSGIKSMKQLPSPGCNQRCFFFFSSALFIAILAFWIIIPQFQFFCPDVGILVVMRLPVLGECQAEARDLALPENTTHGPI